MPRPLRTFEDDFHVCCEAINKHLFAMVLLLKKYRCVKAYRNFRRGLATARALTPLDNTWISEYNADTFSNVYSAFDTLYDDLEIKKKGESPALYALRENLNCYARHVHAIYIDYMRTLQHSNMDYFRFYLIGNTNQLLSNLL